MLYPLRVFVVCTQIICLCDESLGKGMFLPMPTAKIKELMEFFNQHLAPSLISAPKGNVYFKHFINIHSGFRNPCT